MNRPSSLIIVLLTLIGAGCSGLDEDEPLGEQIATDERDDFVEGIVRGSGGVFAPSEAECMADLILGSELTPGDLSEARSDPDSAAQAALGDVSGQCLDPTLSVAAPFEGATRALLTREFTADGFSVEQTECILDGLTAAGFDARDLVLYGLVTQADPAFEEAMSDVAGSCP